MHMCTVHAVQKEQIFGFLHTRATDMSLKCQENAAVSVVNRNEALPLCPSRSTSMLNSSLFHHRVGPKSFAQRSNWGPSWTHSQSAINCRNANEVWLNILRPSESQKGTWLTVNIQIIVMLLETTMTTDWRSKGDRPLLCGCELNPEGCTSKEGYWLS